MKIISSIISALFFLQFSFAQTFEWAHALEFPTANEVAGMDASSDGNIFLTGVFGDIQSLPYNGDSYLVKTDGSGELLWSKVIGPNVIFGDLVCADSDVIIVGQSQDFLQCNGAVFANLEEYDTYMYVMKVSSDGDVEWINQYPERHGQAANLDYHNGVIALQCRGQFNSGNHLIYLDSNGNELNDFEITANISVSEVAYYNEWTYIVGGTPFGTGIEIDNVSIPAPATESLNYVLAFDENLTAQWGQASGAINSNDNQVVAGESGIYSYQTRLNEDFDFFSEIWKMNNNGDLLETIVPPVFTNAVSLYPDMDLSDCHLAFFTSNDFDFNSHEVIIFDHELNVVDEKQINGNSGLYSGQVTIYENQIYVSHIHTDDLDFNGEIQIIDFLDDVFQHPYLAMIGVSESCGSIEGNCDLSDLFVEAHECIEGEFLVDFEFNYSNVSNSFIVSGNGMNYGTFPYGATFYTVGPFTGDGSEHELIITDEDNSSCSTFVEIEPINCPIGDCVIESLELFDFDCDTDSTYSMTFNTEIIDPGNDFIDVWINNEFWNSYEIEDLPITVNGILGSESKYDIIEICVNDNDNCCFEWEYMTPDCLVSFQCSVTELEVFDLVCDSDTTYTLTYNANVENGPNDFIEVSINNEYLGDYEIDNLPLTIYGVEPRDSEYDIIMVCASGLDACCSVLEFEAPDCIIDLVPVEFDFVEVFPNPTSGLLYIVGKQRVTVEVYDSNGKLLFTDKPANGSIDLHRFSSGIYHVVIYESGEEIYRKKVTKE